MTSDVKEYMRQYYNFVRQGYYPTKKQWKFHRYCRDADKANGPVQIGVGGAKAGGKSHATVAQMVLDDAARVPEYKGLFLRKVGKSAQESFFDLINSVCPQYREGYSAYKRTLTLPNGSRILFGGYNSESDIDAYIGISYDGICIEENNQLTALKHELIRGSVRTSKPGWRPRLYSTFNPGGVGHQFIRRLFIQPWKLKQETDTRFVFCTHLDNPHIDDTYRDYLNGLTGIRGRQWREG